MKKLFVLLTIVALVTPFSIGCSDTKKTTPAAKPADTKPADTKPADPAKTP